MSFTTRRATLGTLLAAALIGGGLTPLTSAQTAGASPPQRGQYNLSCPLERIGAQLVRCDALTGAGVPAPAWIHVQTSALRTSR